MTSTILSEEWVKENGELLKNAYSYAVVHKYDIKSEGDVLEVLKAVDPKNANEEFAKTFSKVLQLFSIRFKKTLGNKLEE